VPLTSSGEITGGKGRGADAARLAPTRAGRSGHPSRVEPRGQVRPVGRRRKTQPAAPHAPGIQTSALYGGPEHGRAVPPAQQGLVADLTWSRNDGADRWKDNGVAWCLLLGDHAFPGCFRCWAMGCRSRFPPTFPKPARHADPRRRRGDPLESWPRSFYGARRGRTQAGLALCTRAWIPDGPHGVSCSPIL